METGEAAEKKNGFHTPFFLFGPPPFHCLPPGSLPIFIVCVCVCFFAFFFRFIRLHFLFFTFTIFFLFNFCIK